MKEVIKTVQFKFAQNTTYDFSMFLKIDKMVADYLDDVFKSTVDPFGRLLEHDSYVSGLEVVGLLDNMGLIGRQESERLFNLFGDAMIEAHKRHDRLVKALQRREQMRSSVKARRMGARG